MSENQDKKCSKCKKTQTLESFANGKALWKNVVSINSITEKTIEKNCDKKSGNAMNNTKDKNLRNRKKRLNAPSVRLTFQNVKTQKNPTTKHLHKPNPKQIEQKRKTDEKIKRIKHQEVIDYLNATFPSYPDG